MIDPDRRAERRARFDAWYSRQQTRGRPARIQPTDPKQRRREAGTAGIKGQTKHGTPAGYYWHSQHGDRVDKMRECGCAEAGRIYRAEIRRKQAAKSLATAPCGTFRAYQRHRAEGVGIEELNTICPACWQVYVARFGRRRPPGQRYRR